MTTQSAGGAPAKRVKSVTNPTQITGNVARRVIPVTDGRAADAGAAEQVYYVLTADLVENGGRFTVSGEQAIPVINVTSGAVRGGAVMPVYDVTGQAEPANGPDGGGGESFVNPNGLDYFKLNDPLVPLRGNVNSTGLDYFKLGEPFAGWSRTT